MGNIAFFDANRPAKFLHLTLARIARYAIARIAVYRSHPPGFLGGSRH